MELESLRDDNYQYYHVIPVEVLYNSTLSDKAKLLFVTISGLCNTTGFSWATNSYYEEKLQWSKSSVSRALAELKKVKAISIKNEIKEGVVVKRTITTPYRKLKEWGSQDRQGGLSQETRGVITDDNYNNINRKKKYNNKPSASFSNFKKQKTILDMTFDEWLVSVKKEDKEHRFDETKSKTDGEGEYFLLMRQREFQRLQQEAINESKI